MQFQHAPSRSIFIDRHLPWLALAILYGLADAKLVALHGVFWSTWADQTRYLTSATALANLRFDPAEHWYPLLYPLLGAPFARLWPAMPFVLVDAICFVGTFIGFASVARRFGIGPWLAATVFAVSTILYPEMGRRWLEPWTTTPSAALIWLAIAATLAIFDAPASRRTAIGLALCLAAIPMVRPGDAGVAVVLGAMAGWKLIARREWGIVALIAIVALACLAAYGALHVAIYGLHPSDYAVLSTEYGENFGWLGWKAYVLLLDPGAWFPEGEGLLHAFPWLILGAAGLLFEVVRQGRQRLAAACIGLALAVYGATMIAYVDLLPSGLWRFNNVHYFKWMFPAFALFLVLFLRDVRHAPLTGAAIAAVLCLATCIRIVPVAVGVDEPARMLFFAQPQADFRTFYFGRSIVDDRKGVSRNIFDFHQIPASDGRFVAIALKRDFAGHETWSARSSSVKWPRTVPGLYQDVTGAGEERRAPLQRFAATIGFGVPCWTRLTHCQRLTQATHIGA